jgi:putative colanic acid biosysnthesis UDP-glucose lipid carrier transferase
MSRESSVSPRRGFLANAIRMLPAVQILVDGAMLLLGGYGLFYGLVYYSYKSADFYNAAIIFNCLLTVMLLYFAGLYQFEAVVSSWRNIDKVVIAVVTAFAFMIAMAFSVKVSDIFSRIWVASFFGYCIIALVLMRVLMSWFLSKLGQGLILARNVAFYGEGHQLEQLLSHFGKSKLAFVNLVGVFSAEKSSSAALPQQATFGGNLDDLIAFARSSKPLDIIVAMPWADKDKVAAVLAKLRDLPNSVYLCADSVGFSVPMWQPPSYFQKLPIFEVIGEALSPWDVLLKLIEDLVLGTIILILISPLLLLVAIAIKLDSPGPVLFKQKRLGFNNRPFDIYKFRSMTFEETPAGKTIQARRADPRVTRVGRLLRASSIDELPQLLNVLNGTMSLVGPRPHAIDHNEEYAEKIRGYFSRHRVKPGITGLAQVMGYRGITDTIEKMEGRVRYDIEYTEKWSLWLDVSILLRTIVAVIIGKNAF